MFTGIITHLGKIQAKSSTRLGIQSDHDLMQKLSLGSSVSVNGICLTVVALDKTSFSIDFIPETAQKTNIQYLQEKDLVNLELPATAETLLSGHIVQGHVDGVGKILSITEQGNSWLFKFSISSKLGTYIVEKGSICVNGISLTVIEIQDDFFTVGIIPHTWEKTMLHTAKVGDSVNLEVDVLAKYIEKLTARKK